MKNSGEYIKEDIEVVIKGCRKNKRASQKILYDRYFERLYVHCQSYRLSDQDKVALINKTMLKVFQNLDKCQGGGAMDGWIHTIHKNVILNHFRALNRQKSKVTFDTEAVSGWEKTNGTQVNDMDMEYIHIAMASLPEQTREVLELYAIQGYKHTEIARMLDMSESYSKYHLGKARELMADKLKKDYGGK